MIDKHTVVKRFDNSSSSATRSVDYVKIIINKKYWETKPVFSGNKIILGWNIIKAVKLLADHGKCIIDNIYTGLVDDNTKKWIQEADCKPYSLVLKNPLQVIPFKVSCKTIPTEEIIIEKQINEWKNKEIIQYSTSEWAAEPIVVPKPNGEHRICINYKPLNKVTRVPYTILANIGIIGCMARFRHKCKLDLKDGYLQIPIHKDTKQYTAFATNFGHFEFNRMPFGLAGAPQHFQNCLQQKFQKSPHYNNNLFIYLDDIIMGHNDKDKLVEIRRTVIEELKKDNWQINWAKATPITETLDILGYKVDNNGSYRPIPRHIHKLINTVPHNILQLETYLGILTYIRKFTPLINNYTVQLRNTVKSLNMEDATKIIKTLQEDLRQNEHLLPLRPINFYKTLHIFVDFSNEKMTFIACQSTESKKDDIVNFNDDHLDFHIIDINFKETPQVKTPNAQRGELLAIKFALDKTETILLPNNTILYTDNINILTSSKINKQQVNMQFDIITVVNKYNIHIQYFPGKNNIADPISRLLIWARSVCGLPKRNTTDQNKIKNKVAKTEHVLATEGFELPPLKNEESCIDPITQKYNGKLDAYKRAYNYYIPQFGQYYNQVVDFLR